MNSNVLDLKMGSKKKRNKETLNTKFYRVSEKEIEEVIDSAAEHIDKSTQATLVVAKKYKELANSYEELIQKYTNLAEVYTDLGERFLKENADADNYFEMFQILCDSVVLSDVETAVVPHIQKEMELWEEEGGYFEHKKGSYMRAIDEIQEFSQMLKGDKYE